MRTMLLAVACLTAAVLLPSCGSDDPIGYSFTADDLGSTTDIQVGQLVVLALPENPSTGFSWHRSWEPTARLKLTDDRFVPADSDAAGAGGTRHFTFETLSAGQVVITVQYGRWWEGGEQQDPQTLTFNLTD